MRRTLLGLCCLLLLAPAPGGADGPAHVVDIASLGTDEDIFLRVSGSNNDGSAGVPIAGGFDCDADGFVDYAMGSFQAHVCEDPNAGCDTPANDRFSAGEVHLIFGSGVIAGSVDTASLPAAAPANRLLIAGDQDLELTGSEIWMDDVTGDGIGDLLIARQNYTPVAGRIGAGALTILVGGPELRSFANSLQVLDLRSPPQSLTLVTIVGAQEMDRLGIWMRTGDVTGDGVADIAVGADQASLPLEKHRGEVYVIRGGTHLEVSQRVDLANFASTGTLLAGHVARIVPPAGAAHFHLGATVQVADLDRNGHAEVIAAAALARAGADIGPSGGDVSHHANGGTEDGTVYIAWDDNFPAELWTTSYTIELGMPPGTRTVIHGADVHEAFGEELLGGLDYDHDGTADLFVGDLVSDVNARSNAGRGLVIYDVASLKGLSVDMQSPPMGLEVSEFLGGRSTHIAADTAMQGDFDGDGFDDLAFSSPHASPLGRSNAGTIHVFHGQQGLWPQSIDLRGGRLPPASELRISEIYGGAAGDVLCYSGAAGDVDQDGRTDFITNEMLGNGLDPSDTDVGNLVVLSGALVPEPTKGALGFFAGLTLVALRRRHAGGLAAHSKSFELARPPGPV